MINFSINLFGLSIKLDIDFRRNADKRADKRKSHNNSSDENKDVLPTFEETPEYAPITEETEITHQMRKFEEELRKAQIYDIPTNDDIPPRHNIQDDVEIITDRFEREIEDIYEGRR